jgi:hypothetical protein
MNEPTMADVQRDFPAWRCWRAASGLYYARRSDPSGPGLSVKGEDLLDLRDQIIRAESLASR